MKPTVYLETTVPSYQVARLSASVVMAGHQAITREFWRVAARRFDRCISQFVIDESAEGEPAMARKRLRLLQGIKLLPITWDALNLCRRLRDSGLFPARAVQDASHIGMAAVHGIHFLATWNFAHIANVKTQHRIRDLCRGEGFECPVICTPEELLEL